MGSWAVEREKKRAARRRRGVMVESESIDGRLRMLKQEEVGVRLCRWRIGGGGGVLRFLWKKDVKARIREWLAGRSSGSARELYEKPDRRAVVELLQASVGTPRF